MGGNKGPITASILKAHPHLTGINADLPALKDVCEAFIKSQHLEGRMTFQSIDFFKEEFPQTDAVIFGHILHDWELNVKEMLLNKAFKSLNKGGACIVYEALIDDERREASGALLMSINMLLHTKGEEMTRGFG
jgi:hypothetical protein